MSEPTAFISRARKNAFAAFSIVLIATCAALQAPYLQITPAILALFAIAIVAAHIDTQVGNINVSADIVAIVVAVIIDPLTGSFVALATLLQRADSIYSRIASGSSVFAAASAASLSVMLQHNATHGFSDIVIAGASALGTFLVINALLTGVALVYHHVARPGEFYRFVLASMVASSITVLPLIVAIAAAYFHYGFWVLPLVLIPLTLVQYFHGLYHKKATLTVELAEVNEVLAKTNLQFAAAMIRALDARDAYTAGHSAAVAVYTRDIARESGCDEKTIRLAHLAGLLHDIGKIGVAGSILNKTDRLTDEEFELMKDHAAIGAGILSEVDSYGEISMLVRHHHERIDGKGYPDQIGGDFIPAISRMISVADTYSAMTTDRPYRQGMPTPKAMAILGEASGSGQLDEMYTAVFLRILRRADDAYLRGKQTSFEVEVAKHEALGDFEQQVLDREPGEAELTPDEIEREAA